MCQSCKIDSTEIVEEETGKNAKYIKHLKEKKFILNPVISSIDLKWNQTLFLSITSIVRDLPVAMHPTF